MNPLVLSYCTSLINPSWPMNWRNGEVAGDSSNCQQLTTELGVFGLRMARRVSSIQARQGMLDGFSHTRPSAGTLNVDIQSLVL